MSKNKATSSRSAGAARERAEVQASESWIKRNAEGRSSARKKDSSPAKGVRREVLFPTEPSTIGNRKIERAVELVISRRK
jgi:hypothetical protein